MDGCVGVWPLGRVPHQGRKETCILICIRTGLHKYTYIINHAARRRGWQCNGFLWFVLYVLVPLIQSLL
jgi:hypothetical protein